MPLHLVKLCVGVTTLEEMREWVDERAAERRARAQPQEQIHTTRMLPRRGAELLDGGSLYWVIKGNVQARQRLVGIRPFTDGEGVSRCHLVLDPVLIPTRWQPRRAFQGWRYLAEAEAPADLGPGGQEDELPGDLRSQLAQLGLL